MSDAPPPTYEAERPDLSFWGPVDPADDRPSFAARPAPWGGPLERALDRFRDLRTDPKFGIAALLVMALVAGIVWYRMGVSSAPAETSTGPVGSAPAASAPTGTTSPPGTTTPTDEVTVHVAGAVASPGVYELLGAARVIDAVEAAGGGSAEADLDRLNLAAKLADGQRVLVQRVGDPAASPVAGTADTVGVPGGGPGAPVGLVNLNTATQLELETLPGIGPTLAQAMLAERDRRGGFRSVNELRSVRGIGDKRFADLQPLVTV